MKKEDDRPMEFSISKNWDVEVDQFKKDEEIISFAGDLVLDTDIFAISEHEKIFRFLLPDEIYSVRCHADGSPSKNDRYRYCLEFDVSGFEREWLIANNPEIKELLESKLDEQCFVVSDEYIPGKFVNLN